MDEKDKIVELNTGKIEIPKIDLKQYVGKKTVIETVEERKGKYGFYVFLATPSVTTIKDLEGNEKPLKGSVIIGLQKDSEGNIGWGDGTKMDCFLKYYKVNHYKELVGTDVVFQIKTGKDGQEFLTFA